MYIVITMESIVLREFERELSELPREWVDALNKCFLARNIDNVHTKSSYTRTILNFYRITGKRPHEVTREDVENWLRFLRENKSLGTYTEYVKNFKVIMKVLNGGEEYPDCVKWVKLPSRRKALKSKDMRDKILTQDEIKRLVNATNDLMYKALIMTLYDGALRIGEALSLRIRDVEFNRLGCVVTVFGKTGERTLLLTIAEPYIRNWLQIHPQRDNPNAYLFVTSRGGKVRKLTQIAVNTYFRRLGERAGISKKVHPHILRHTRLTELAKILTEQELKAVAGWTKDSRMAATYVHLSGRDTIRAMTKAAGITEEVEEKPITFETKICPRCGSKNTYEAKQYFAS